MDTEKHGPFWTVFTGSMSSKAGVLIRTRVADLRAEAATENLARKGLPKPVRTGARMACDPMASTLVTAGITRSSAGHEVRGSPRLRGAPAFGRNSVD